ncbi:putative type IX secretion system sortase PorU2 [Spirosoma radiotolerans]|nr:C25 family cysteine peptidase [Spirosoma radiotolerans]
MTQGQSTADPDPTRWLTYSQSYYKIPIAKAGIYRITTRDLQQAGVPVHEIDPTTIQLFHRGVEQAIFLAGEADRRFDMDDFLEFFGRGNDGVPDSLLYHPNRAQPHRFYSLFNDTTAYFLTWQANGKPGRRMTTYVDTTHGELLLPPYHWAEDLRVFTENYPGWAAGIAPKIEYSFYEAGEGYTGVVQQKGKPYTTTYLLSNAVTTGPLPSVDILLTGRDYTNHQVDCFIGPRPDQMRLLDSVRFSTYDNARIQQPIDWSDVGSDGILFISTVSRGENSTADNYSVSYIRFRYPQTLTANGQPFRLFQLEPNAGLDRSLLVISDAPANTRFWDITDPNAPVQLRTTSSATGSTQLLVHGSLTWKTIFCTSQPLSISTIHPVTFTNWSHRKPTYLIISHETLLKPGATSANAVQEYAAYRASAVGGGYDTLTVTMQQLFDQYSYGERHPLAIRRFLTQLIQQSKSSLAYLLLIGQSRSTPGIRRNPNQAMLDMVMTAGFPGSDIVFSAGLNGYPEQVPAIPTGRINAATPEDVLNYLAKVKAYEHPDADKSWRKRLLHLSGGQTPGEQDLFHRLVESYRSQASTQSLGAQVTVLSKETDRTVESAQVVTPVNEGVGLITFFGHSGLDITDLDIGFCSNDALGYRNKDRYPLLLVNGCALGNFFYGHPTLATDWVLAPDRGAIAAIAHSHLGYVDVMHTYSATFYGLLADSLQVDKSVGQLQQETIRRVLAQSTDGRAVANCQQMVLQGDPAIRLFPFRTPDYALTAGGLTVAGADQKPLTSLSDSVQIRAVVQNKGQYWRGVLPVRVRRWVNGRESGVFNLRVSPVAFQDTFRLSFPNERDADGQNQFEVTVNPADSPIGQNEANHANNQATAELTISDQKPVLIFPAPNSLIGQTAIPLTAQYLTKGTHTFELELDSTAQFNSAFTRRQRIVASNRISYPAVLPTRPNTTYYWRVRLAEKVDGATQDNLNTWVTGSFMYVPNSTAIGLPEGQLWLSAPLPVDAQQGDILSISAHFTNLSPVSFTDSLIVRQTIYAAGLANAQTKTWTVKAPLTGDTLQLTTSIDTEKLPGINRVVLTVNPRLQPEYSFLNNTLDLSLPVQPDRLGPILEVGIDGARITNGATISAQPVIDILVADDNRALIRRDTSGLDLYLQRPGKNIAFERLSWHNAISWPTAPDNVFRLRYPSPPLSEGVYQLLVTASDRIGNRAVPYQVRFQVVNDRKLTQLTISPNPFHDQVLFSFYLTGDLAPAHATLTITNLSGHPVRQITRSVRVGLNEWTWDGGDNSGRLLPAGAYLYKLALSTADGIDWPVADDVLGKLDGRLILNR